MCLVGPGTFTAWPGQSVYDGRMLCEASGCGCALTVASGSITGSGTPADPWVLDVAATTEIAQIEVDLANIDTALDALPGTYVNVTGDSMSGALSVTAALEALQIHRTVDGPHIGWYRLDNTRMFYLQAIDSGSLVNFGGEAGMALCFRPGGAEKMRMLGDGSTILMYKTASDQAVAGQEFAATGSGTFTRTADAAPGVAINKAGSGVSSGTGYIEFRLSGTVIGSVTRNASTSAVLYNTSSDEELKDHITAIDPEVAEWVAALVTPKMFTWKSDPDATPTAGYIAQEVAAAWPGAVECGLVTAGCGDPANRTWDKDGNETTPEGAWSPWQMDHSRLVPILHSALQALSAKYDALNAKYDALEARVAKLDGGKPAESLP